MIFISLVEIAVESSHGAVGGAGGGDKLQHRVWKAVMIGVLLWGRVVTVVPLLLHPGKGLSGSLTLS